MKRRVVITGWGLVTSLSNDVDDCWNRVLAGESGIHEIRLFDTSDIKVQIGGDVYDWDASEALGQKEVNKVDRYSQFAMVAAQKAIESANFSPHGCMVFPWGGRERKILLIVARKEEMA